MKNNIVINSNFAPHFGFFFFSRQLGITRSKVEDKTNVPTNQITFHKNCMNLQFQWQRGLVLLHPYQHQGFVFVLVFRSDLIGLHIVEVLTCL